ELENNELSMIHISLDGHDKKTQEIIRGNNTFERTINGIKKLKVLGIYLRIGTVIYKENQNHLEEIIKLVISLGVNEIIFSIMEPVGRMLGSNKFFITKNIKELEDEIKILKIKYNNIIKVNYNWDNTNINDITECPAGERFLYINNLGNIAPCTWVVTKNSKYLSKLTLKNQGLKDVLKDKKLKEFMEYKNSNKCGECIANKIGKK
ncbi:MAG: radical SAM protein, partial [Bacilli bacterium]|nr:radical SAM protein [Bacilli bacterium]